MSRMLCDPPSAVSIFVTCHNVDLTSQEVALKISPSMDPRLLMQPKLKHSFVCVQEHFPSSGEICYPCEETLVGSLGTCMHMRCELFVEVVLQCLSGSVLHHAGFYSVACPHAV